MTSNLGILCFVACCAAVLNIMALPVPQAFPAFGSFDGSFSGDAQPNNPFGGGLFASQQQGQLSPFGGGGAGNLFGASSALGVFGGTTQTQLQQQHQTQQKADAAGVQDVSVGQGKANLLSNSNSKQQDGRALANSQSTFQGDGTDQNIKLVEQTQGAVQSQSGNKGQSMMTLPGMTAGVQSSDQIQRQNSANGQVVNQGSVADGQTQFGTLSNTNVDQNGSSQTSGTSSQARGRGIHITSGSGSSAAGQMAKQSNTQAKLVSAPGNHMLF